MIKKTFTFFVIISIALPGLVSAQDKSFYEDAKRGWYWYEDPPPKDSGNEMPNENPKKKYPSLKDYSMEELWFMDPDEFSALREKLARKSIQNPDDRAAMKDYFTVLDMSRRKSLAWSGATQSFLMENPEYNLASSVPIAAPGRAALTRMQNTEIESHVRNAKDDYGILYFKSAGCEFCHAQDGILEYFTGKYGWVIKPVYIEENPGAAAGFNVSTVPAMFLVSREKGTHLAISVGVSSLTELEEGIYRGVRLLDGSAEPGDFSTYEFQKGGVLDPYAPLRK